MEMSEEEVKEFLALNRRIEILSQEDFDNFVSILDEAERVAEEQDRARALEAEVQAKRTVLVQEYHDAKDSGDERRYAKARVALNVFDRQNGYL